MLTGNKSKLKIRHNAPSLPRYQPFHQPHARHAVKQNVLDRVS